MSLKLIESPTYLKKKEIKPDTFAFEGLSYVNSKENKASMYPNTAGSINHVFKNEEGKLFAISGDTVMNRLVEENLWKGRKCSFLYKGKVDDNGDAVKYHNWKIAVDPSEEEPSNQVEMNLSSANELE